MAESDDQAFEAVLSRIAARANTLDRSGDWVGDDLADLASVGATAWAIPASHGGLDLDVPELQTRYERIAAASLATALAFSQRDSGVGHVEKAENTALRDELLPKLARNAVWTTIGISHITTSTQAGALGAVMEADGGVRLNGTIPWSTGAAFSDFIVAAARVPNGEPVVFALPTDLDGVTIGRNLPLAALTAAHTSAVHCTDVRIDPSLLLTGPAADAMGGKSRGVRVSQAFAALGLTVAALRLIDQIDYAGARTAHEALSCELAGVRQLVAEVNAAESPAPTAVPAARAALNDLALRAAHTAVTLHKGGALRIDHPAQRLAREALFLLVWSSPMSVVDKNLELLTARDASGC